MSQLSPEGEIANRFQLISRMADDLAHEIKNPLNSMVINIELMRSRARKGDAAGILERADVLETEVRRLNGLVDGMLKLLRPDRMTSDEIALDPVLMELGELIGLQAKLARKELVVTPLGEMAVARGRRDAIRFALLNLLAAELDAVAGDDARVEVGGLPDLEAILIRIASRSESTAEEAVVRLEAALETARALLHGGGGDVQVEAQPFEGGTERVVTVRLPRAGRA